MLSKIESYGLNGLQGFGVQVEVDVSGGLPAYDTVGLPDAAVRESRERVRAAIRNSGFTYPMQRVTINLAPADLKKEGSIYDLPIAIGILTAMGQVPAQEAAGYVFLGELALDGGVRGIAGILPMLISAGEAGARQAMLPAENAGEASFIAGVKTVAIDSLGQAVRILRGEEPAKACERAPWQSAAPHPGMDFADIKGQQGAKRAAEVAAAGGHNLLLVGTPGSGKTMLARRIPSILPTLSFEEALEITKIHSIVGAVKGANTIATERPFRAPHHTASTVSLVGGGSKALPGEVSLAHYGVLFLDELPEFPKEAIEALRQPLEDGTVTITRASSRATYPADFMLIAAMNPCPCGNFGSRLSRCRCAPAQINRYRGKISGPMLDRVDLHVEMSEVGYGDIVSKSTGESSTVIRARVNAARELQRRRYANEGILFNAQLSGKQIRRFCRIDAQGEALLKRAFDALKLSARAYDRIMKVSRTIADLEGSEFILAQHISEAVQYRSLDQKYWGGGSGGK
ncbi:MAG: YifB family Mg chelatase-like AAA ATPase [Christensenellaceae bacterium]|nr:YifB family Mg chelatase-like AAA ATPase [Christensenellaceae bacterium]